MNPRKWIDPYDYLLFMPVGRRYGTIRSIGHKSERAVLSRLQQAARNALEQLCYWEMKQMKRFLQTDHWCLPVPVTKKEELYPALIRPEMFLWQEHSVQRGLPIEPHLFYNRFYSKLSAEALEEHVQQVVREYVFCAIIHEKSQEEWLARIASAYARHPFIQLAHKKQAVVAAVEAMNRSSLLSVLTAPEDVAYWRHRVEIVMRPYRAVPATWRWHMCDHPKTLHIQADQQAIVCQCSSCEYAVLYKVSEDRIVLQEEPDMERTVKRIATIERQFNDIAMQSERVVSAIRKLQHIQKNLFVHQHLLDQLLSLQQTLDVPLTPETAFYEKVSQSVLPDEPVSPTLMSLSDVSLAAIDLLKQAREWPSDQLNPQQIEKQIETLSATLDQQRPQPDDVMFEQEHCVLIRREADQIAAFLTETTVRMTSHLLIQLLKGSATNKVRTLNLHETDLFGILNTWPEKYIAALVKQQFKTLL